MGVLDDSWSTSHGPINYIHVQVHATNVVNDLTAAGVLDVTYR